MKKAIITIIAMILGILLALSLTGCNKQIIDTNYTFNYCIIKLQNGEVIEGKVQTWKDYEGEQLQVKVDGVVYLTNSINCTLINK